MSIPEYACVNFNRLLRATACGDLALVECADAVTGEPRFVFCALARDSADYADSALRPTRAGQSLRGL
jgi:Family of unknown function (DUF6117)